MKNVFLLRHTYEYGEEQEHDSTKELGIYSSYEKAREAIDRYYGLAGFKRYDYNCFIICEYEVDKDSEWTEGFMTWEEMDQGI